MECAMTVSLNYAIILSLYLCQWYSEEQDLEDRLQSAEGQSHLWVEHKSPKKPEKVSSCDDDSVPFFFKSMI